MGKITLHVENGRVRLPPRPVTGPVAEEKGAGRRSPPAARGLEPFEGGCVYSTMYYGIVDVDNWSCECSAHPREGRRTCILQQATN